MVVTLMDSDQREIIRSSLHQIDLILRAIWRTAREQIKQAELVQKRIDDIEKLKKPLYEVLERDAQPTDELGLTYITPCKDLSHELPGYNGNLLPEDLDNKEKLP